MEPTNKEKGKKPVPSSSSPPAIEPAVGRSLVLNREALEKGKRNPLSPPHLSLSPPVAPQPSAARPRLPRPCAAAPPRLRPPVRDATSPDPRSPAASRCHLRRVARRHLPTSSPLRRGSLVAGRPDLEILRCHGSGAPRSSAPRSLPRVATAAPRCLAPVAPLYAVLKPCFSSILLSKSSSHLIHWRPQPVGRYYCWWRDCHRCEIAAVLGAASRRGHCRVVAAPAPLLLASSWPPLLPVEHGLLLAIGPPPVCQQLDEHLYMRVNPEDDMHGSLGSSILLAAWASSLPE
ncbi:uncharacterized protein [Aegilops tauschii subsp. strangulata]|uniref:uncharacterized protein n=1 Tax=Aegilops tauschii subsp. strangulata TaxID=200361 RepID=UPI00098B9EF5